VIPWASIWRVIAAVVVTGIGIWAVIEMRALVSMIALAFFFSLALVEFPPLARQFGYAAMVVVV
jgi:hypothetical protein